MKKEKRIINKLPLYLSVLFLFNPNFTVIDPLPDFVGYILLCVAIYRIADVGDMLGEAYSAFKRMIFIDAGKWLAVLWIFGMTVPSERNSSYLLWTFVFAVLEMIFLLPAYGKLFGGITQIGYLFPSASIFGKNKKHSRTDRMRALTVVFVIVKAVFTFLPELADLTNTAYDETVTSTVNLYRYIGLMRALSFIPVLVVGVAWVISMLSYYRAIVSDKLLMSALSESYKTNVLPRKGIFVRRNFKTFSLIFFVAMLLTVDLRIDDINMLPDYLCAAFFIIAIVFLKKYNDSKVVLKIFLAAAHLCVSVAASVLENYFFNEYYYSAILKSDVARGIYIGVVALNAVKSILLFATVGGIYKMILRTIELHTGYVVGMERHGESEERLIKNLRSDLKRGLIYAMSSLGLYIVSDVCFDIFAPKAYFMGFINIICAAVCIGLFIKAISAVQHAVDTKYMLE